MGKNIKGGKKHKKYKNKNQPLRKKELILADSGTSQEYFSITKMLGDGRCLGNGSDGRKDVLCIIRGRMRKKVWIHSGDKVLGSYRDFNSGRPIADIIHKYSEDEVNVLRRSYHIIFTVNKDSIENINNENENDSDDCGFTFEDL